MQRVLYKLIDKIRGRAPRGKDRSADWFQVRRGHLKRQPDCQVCGGRKKLEVHHIIPFWVAPELELEPDNLITLCDGRKYARCHYLFGHFGDYKKWNENVKQDASYFMKRIKEKREEWPDSIK